MNEILFAISCMLAFISVMYLLSSMLNLKNPNVNDDSHYTKIDGCIKDYANTHKG